MAPFVPLAAGAQVEAVFNLGGTVVENRFWFVYDTPPYGVPEIVILCNGFYNWHVANVMPLLSSDIELDHVIATSWFTSLHFGAFTTAPPVAGGTASPSHSANVAVVVPFKWALGFREKANKNYVPGIPISGVDLNTPTAAFSNDLWEAYVSLIDAARTWGPVQQWRWVVTSAYDGGSARSTQLWTSCQGVPRPGHFKLGQRRSRLI